MKVKSKRLHKLVMTTALAYRSLSNNRTKDRHAFHLGDVYVMLLDWFGGVSREDSTTEGAFILHIHSQPCFHSGTG